MMPPLMTARTIAAIAFPPMLYCQCPGQGKTPLPPAANDGVGACATGVGCRSPAVVAA